MRAEDIDLRHPTPLLGGLSPQAFMRRYWQRRPLLVRGAWPGVQPPLPRPQLFALAASECVESRLVERTGGGPRDWRVRHGPFARRALPPLSRARWTLLVQGLDLHVAAAHDMLAPFRFVPAARLDDLMVSWASDGGGVGPHVDAYDVFLLQVSGRRRWRVAPPAPGDAAFVARLPLKILRRFVPVHEWVLEPGDMLYLPPLWGHDGAAVGGDCMTCSVGFRTPSAGGLAGELLQRLADAAATEATRHPRHYTDAAQAATARPGAVPAALQRFAERAVAMALREPQALARALGEVLSDPKPQVWFDAGDRLPPRCGVRLDARTRLLYDAHHLFINGEALRLEGGAAHGLRRLADRRELTAGEVSRLAPDALRCLSQWAEAGWLHAATKAVARAAPVRSERKAKERGR
ncbi:MAG: cupin domain-containing protein [Rubrivivax sp.]|nr:cupin domain-containing protein [Rubrivivax sp.]